jgi:hypothetical protein
MASTPTITFGHGNRHATALGSNPANVQRAITKTITQQSKAGAKFTDSFWGRVKVDNKTYTFRAMPLGNNKINVGTYYGPRH